MGPGWYGSVVWAPACDLKGYQFDSQLGHMPGLQAKSPVGDDQEATNQCFSPSLSPSLLLSLKIKSKKKEEEKRVEHGFQTNRIAQDKN